MTTTKQRVAALVIAGLLATAGALATSATFAASDAHAVGENTGNAQNHWDY
jgi:hypothetical protein